MTEDARGKGRGPEASVNGVDEGLDGFGALKVHQAVEDNVQSLEGDQGLVEHFAVEAAGGLGVEGGNASGKGGLDGHLLGVGC